MSIEGFREKIKQYHADGGKERIFMLLVLLLTASFAFGLGRLSAAPGHDPITVGHFDALPGMAASSAATSSDIGIQAAAAVSGALPAKAAPAARTASSVFASKSGAKYYTQGCKSRVSEANKIWFPSAADAEKIGLSKAAGCK